MADQPLTIFEKYPNSYRLDHPDFGEVCKTTYAKGVITAFYPYQDSTDKGNYGSTAPLVVLDKCDVKVGGNEYQKVPIFYHIPGGYINNFKENANPGIHAYGATSGPDNFWKNSGALVDKDGKAIDLVPKEGLPYDGQTITRAAYSFTIGDEVVVMFQGGDAVAVLGFSDGKPRRPLDYLRIDLPKQFIESSDPDSLYGPQGPYCLQLSDLMRATTPSGFAPGDLTEKPDPPPWKGPDGFELKFPKEATQYPDKVDRQHDEGVIDLVFDYSYYVGYEPFSVGPAMILDPTFWTPPPDPAFGPFYGYMNFGWDSPWADYLAAWLNICNIQQTLDAPYPGGSSNPWVGVWPNGIIPPFGWFISALQGSFVADEYFVMRTYSFIIGPKVYIFRVLYYHAVFDSITHFYRWKNRVVWPWDGFVPPIDWSGYTFADPSLVTAPIWPLNPDPTPTDISQCYPPPDDELPEINYHSESFYNDNPQWLYEAIATKDIMDNLENIISASNAKVNVHDAQQYGEPPPIPEGFTYNNPDSPGGPVPNGGLIPYAGNYRELKITIEAQMGE